MEQLLNPPWVSKGPLFLFLPRYSIFASCRTTRQRKNFCEFHKYPYSFSFSLSTTRRRRNVHVSAHFGGPTNRRNSLRKKLLTDHQQVRQNNPTPLNPSSDFREELHNTYTLDDTQEENLDSNKTKLNKKLGEESVMSTKLEKWVDQYNKDTAFWGIGSAHIFTIFHDLEGNVKRVLVDEKEIIKRSSQLALGKQQQQQESSSVTEVNSKILYAKGLAKEMERGANIIPRNSSVAKFVVSSENSSGFINAVRSVIFQPEFIPVVTGFGKIIFCGFIAIWALNKLFTFGNKEKDKLTEFEKEMMRRKIKYRKEKDMHKKGQVEVVQQPSQLPIERRKLDKQELMRRIVEAESDKDKLLLVGSSSSQTTNGMDFDVDERIHKIRTMAREARAIELGEEEPTVDDDGEEKQRVIKESSCEVEMVGGHIVEVVSFGSDITNKESDQRREMNDTQVLSLDRPKGGDIEHPNEVSTDTDKVMQSSLSSSLEVSKGTQTTTSEKVKFSSDDPGGEIHMPNDGSTMIRPRIIRSVKEARAFLAKRGNKQSQESEVDNGQECTIALAPNSDKASDGKMSQRTNKVRQVSEPVALSRTLDPLPVADMHEDLIPKAKEFISSSEDNSKNSEGDKVHNLQYSQTLCSGNINSSTGKRQSVQMDNWMEKNFHEVEPIIKKIGDGMRDNYNLAREKVNQHTSAVMNLDYIKDDSEFEWMKDDDLREIVFKVRENELSGRDPFYLIDAEDKLKFFKGLEKKVEKENEKLFKVHEYLHSNIENLDYGADGISLYDQPEKFIPRWQGAPLEKNPEFLNNFQKLQTGITGNASISYLMKDEESLIRKSTESTVNENAASSLSDNVLGKNLRNRDATESKTIIEGSDGSVRAGKKSGKEFWQHTKKWSRGFLESYNDETDPEIKSIMKDMGKDLDRWITEEEIQESADLMKNLHEKNKKFMQKKMNKLKREMELFGPQAVVSKYREYAEEKEEDYLWWLDLPHILCVELYTTQNGEQKVGFYSLEMAADLELEPKPCHVIAFEDAGDCKNFCHLVQAHMDMLGNGHAFIVPRPPKDAFQDAKANGFGVTVIRKMELVLNVDQTLEEVEEQIAEIGSKMYHDELMRERSVDISALMKGVFGFNGRPISSKRKRSKRTLKKPRKK